MKKLLMVVILLFLTVATVSSKDENIISEQKELLIINNNAVLYESESITSKQVRTLNFLEKIYLIKEGSGKRVFIITEKNEKGWVDSINTTIIPSNWKKIDCYDGLSISIPPNVKFRFDKGEWEKHRNGDSFIEERENKIFADNFFTIIIVRSSESLQEVVENQKNSDDVSNYKSIYIEKNFNKKEIVFIKSSGMDSLQEYYVVMQNKNNSNINILISPETSNPSPEEIRTALKILFSFELKNEK